MLKAYSHSSEVFADGLGIHIFLYGSGNEVYKIGDQSYVVRPSIKKHKINLSGNEITAANKQDILNHQIN